MNIHKQTKKSVWAIRAAKSGKQNVTHEIFITKSLVVLAKQEMGDLRTLPKDRESFYFAYGKTHPEDGKVAIGGIGGKFFRFIHEIKAGDLVLYPCRIDNRIFVGSVVGPYTFNSKQYPDFPHTRKVRWISSFPKKILSQGASRELGAARILFKIKTHTDEILRVVAKLELDASLEADKPATE
jgi:restriction system protein